MTDRKRGRPKGAYAPEGLKARREILVAIDSYQRTHGYYPTTPALQKIVGGSFSRVQWHLRTLREMGYVTYEDGKIAQTLRRTGKDRKLERLR